MSICTCTPKQKDSGRYGKRCTAHNGHSTSAYEERKRPKGQKRKCSKEWYAATRAIYALRVKEGDYAASEAILVAFMFVTAEHPQGANVKLNITYPRPKKS